MKRSDAIKLMIRTYQSLHLGGWSEASEEERMDKVLEALENAGMLPPEYTGDMYDTPEWEEEEFIVEESIPCSLVECGDCIDKAVSNLIPSNIKIKSTKNTACEFCSKSCGNQWCPYTKGCK